MRIKCPICQKPLFPRDETKKKISLTRGFDCIYCGTLVCIKKSTLTQIQTEMKGGEKKWNVKKQKVGCILKKPRK